MNSYAVQQSTENVCYNNFNQTWSNLLTTTLNHLNLHELPLLDRFFNWSRMFALTKLLSTMRGAFYCALSLTCCLTSHHVLSASPNIPKPERDVSVQQRSICYDYIRAAKMSSGKQRLMQRSWHPS